MPISIQSAFIISLTGTVRLKAKCLTVFERKYNMFWEADKSGQFYEQATVVNPCLAGCSSLETDSEIVKKEFFGCEIEETTGQSREYLGCGGTSTSLGVCNQDDCQMKIKIYLGLLWWVSNLV